MDERKNLFVKILKATDRENIDFVAFAQRKSISIVTRQIFAEQADKLKNERPEMWQAFQSVTKGYYTDTPQS